MANLVGEKEKVTIEIVNKSVGYPGLISDRETYDAPNGFAILSYRAIEHNKIGRSGYSFSLTGDNSVFVDEHLLDSKFKRVFDYIDENNEKKYKNRIEQLREEAVRSARTTASTHSKLITEWTVRSGGNTFDRTGGALHLSVEITLIRGISTRNIDPIITHIIDAIKRGEEPKNIKLEG